MKDVATTWSGPTLLVVCQELVKAQEGLVPACTGVWLSHLLGNLETVAGELESLASGERGGQCSRLI